MKLFYLIIAICSITSFQSFGQTFDWVTGNTIETNLDLNTTVLLKMEQTAIGADTVTLGIEIIYNDIPASWDGMVCIHGTCMGIIPPIGTTGTMSPISGAEKGYVRLTVNPLNGTESAKLQIYVYDLDYPNDGDTATWLLNTTLSLEEDDWNDLTVYPNPSNEVISIETSNPIEYTEVYSSNGKLIARCDQKYSNKIKVNVSNLDTGIYILKLIQPNGAFTTRKIQKL